jgi:hypothetical protein
MRKSRRLVIASFLLLLAFIAATAQVKWKGTIVKEGDVTVIRNPKEPLYKTPILEFQEDLSLGGPGARGQDVFNRIGEFVVDDAGNFYIADRMEDHVKVFDRSGRYLRTIGRRGQGPGEFDGMGSLSIVRTTGELAVQNVLKGCLSFFKADGTYLRELPFDERRTNFPRLDSKGNIYAGETIVETGTSRFEFRMVILNREAQLLQILAKAPGADRSKFELFVPGPYWTVDPSDNLVYGYSGTYDIQFFEAGTHTLFKRILKDYDRVPVTEEEKSEFQKPEFERLNFVFAKNHAAFRSFFTSDTGHLIVETFEKAEDGRFIHDVFDQDGILISRMPLKPRGFGISDGKYFALEEDEDGFQTIKRYAVTWAVR